MNRSQTITLSANTRFLAFAVGLAVIAVTSAMAQENDAKPKVIEEAQEQQRVFSGPQLGEKVAPFKVLTVQGDAEKELEIIKETEEGVTLICFIHKLSNDDRVLYGLGLVDFYGGQHEALTSHIVLLSNEREKMMNNLHRWSRGPFFTKSTVSLSLDAAEGPGSYGLNRKVAMTVLVAKGNQVVDNLVFQAPNARDLETIMISVAKALGEPEPTLEEVQKELRAERQRQAEKRIKSSRIFKLAPNEELGRIMYHMVHARGNRMKNAGRRSQQLLEWAGHDGERMAELKKYCKAVLAGEFKPNRYALEAIEELVAD